MRALNDEKILEALQFNQTIIDRIEYELSCLTPEEKDLYDVKDRYYELESLLKQKQIDDLLDEEALKACFDEPNKW